MSYMDKDQKPNIQIKGVDVTLEQLLAATRPLDVNQRLACQVGIYGGKGTGKTIAAVKLAMATLDEGEFLLYIDSAENWSSILNHPEVDHKRILRYQYTGLDSLFTWMKSIKEQKSHPLLSKIGAVVMDEYSSMVQFDLNWITEQRAFALQAQNDHSKDPYTPMWPDYRSVEVRFLKVLKGFMSAKPGMSLIFVSHEKYYEKEAKFRAEMPSATAADFEKLLHGIYRVTADFKKQGDKEVYLRKFQTMPTKSVSAKTRFPVPFYCSLEQLIEGYKAWGRKDLEAKDEVLSEEEEEEIPELS